jgi:hypothetical protein
MQFTSEKIEKTRAHAVQTEQRIVRQRRRVEKLLVERHPADEAQAQLLIMEQSLIAITRFLKNLERDLEMGELSLQRHQTQKRIKAGPPERTGEEKALVSPPTEQPRVEPQPAKLSAAPKSNS